MDTCPICGAVMTEYSDVLDGWCTMEESSVCLNGCYSYEYLTGRTTIIVSGKSFTFNFRTPVKEVEQIQKQINDVITAGVVSG